MAGDAKATALADFNRDGRPDLAVAQNDGPLLTLESSGQRDGTFLQVRLAGRPGNPRGIGARITAMLASGEQRVHEVRAGGGYLSQSSATAFLSVGTQVVERVTVTEDWER